MSLHTPNQWQYAKDFHKCACCGLLRAGKHLTPADGVLAGEYFCTDLAECSSFKTHGHGLNQWPPSGKRPEPPEPPELPTRDERAEEEFCLGPV